MKWPPADRIGRVDLARLLGCHPDSVTRSLRDGLASAVLEWGGHSREMAFSQSLALRWQNARRCSRANGARCPECALALEDALAVAGHLIEVRHGAGGCEDCTPAGPRLCSSCRGPHFGRAPQQPPATREELAREWGVTPALVDQWLADGCPTFEPPAGHDDNEPQYEERSIGMIREWLDEQPGRGA